MLPNYRVHHLDALKARGHDDKSYCAALASVSLTAELQHLDFLCEMPSRIVFAFFRQRSIIWMKCFSESLPRSLGSYLHARGDTRSYTRSSLGCQETSGSVYWLADLL